MRWAPAGRAGARAGTRAGVRSRLGVECLEDRTNPAAVPTVTLTGVPAAPLIGETLSFTVSFDNTSPTDPGFGPYVNLYLPATGADGAGAAIDDGITFVSATYLGTTVPATVVTLTAAGVAHPFARDATGNPIVIAPPAGFQAGDQLVVLQVPFGGFTATQPAANIVVTARMSNLADVGTPLPIRAEGGFRFGNDPLDNPTADPNITGAAATATTTPELLRLTKTYLGPEQETVTGPSYPRQYRISVDVAPGQTITTLDLTDALPPEFQFVSVASTSGGTVSAIATPSTTVPGGTLTRRFASVTGTAAAIDAQVTFNFYVPRVDANGNEIIDPDTGDDVPVTNSGSGQGTWDPIDPRDPVAAVTAGDTDAITVKSIAVQKTLNIVADTGAPGLSPGDTVEYAVTFQISDYFAFDSLVLTDVLSDGQVYVGGSATLTVRDGHRLPATSSGAFALGNVTLQPQDTTTGTTTLLLAISQELEDRGFSADGRLLGGAVPAGGTGGGSLPTATPAPFGPTQGTVRFRTVVQDAYAVNFPSGEPALNQGDPISNDATASGGLLNVSDLTPNGNSETDGTHAESQIASGSFVKTVYAINGVVNAAAAPAIKPGDTVTYRLRYNLPTADVENLRLTDYLPLPIFDVDATGAVTAFDPTVSAAAPLVGRAKFGPSDTFTARSGIVPTVGLDPAANSVAFTYGTYSDPTNAPVVVDLLFTVKVSADPFADQLLLSNAARVESNNTVQESVTGDGIAQVVLGEPELNITKGVVATTNAGGAFAPAAVGPVPFNAPGTIGPRFTGTVTSAGLAARPIDSDLRNVDAGDLVTFALVIENTGTGPNGAFDVRIQDTLPTGFSIPLIGTRGINLRVTNGAGTPLAYALVGGSLFGSTGGIILTDPSATRGAIGPVAGNGTNIVIVTYDLRVNATVNPLAALTNVGAVANYAAVEGGPDFTGPGALTDPATVTVRDVRLAKTLVGTEINNANNSSTEAVVGEFVTYRVVITVPEGAVPGAVLTDFLDPQLAFVALDSAVLSPGLVITGSTTPIVDPLSSGRALTFNLGTILNLNRDNTVAETITLTYRAVVVNTADTAAGDRATNSARFTFTGLSTAKTASAATVTVIEPQVKIDKTVSVDAGGSTGDAGDPFTYTIVLSNPPGASQLTADAFDLTFADLFQAGLAGSPLTVSGFTVTDTAGLVTAALFELVTDPGTGRLVLRTRAGQSFDLPVSGTRSVTIRVTGSVATSVTPGQVVPNTAEVRWTSLNGDPGQRSAFTPASTERTGADGAGGLNDYVATDAADINVLNVDLTKSVVSTSEAATTDPAAVVVGEVVRYRVVVAVPEFGTPTQFQFVDTLPAGMVLLPGGRIAFVSDAGDALTSTTLPPDLDPDPLTPPNLYLTGDESTVATVVPEFPIPGDVVTIAPVGGRQRVTVDLGLVSNPDVPGDNDLEFIVAEFNALVTNVPGNQAGTSLVNEVATLQGPALTPTGEVASTALRVAEPAISGVAKTVVSLVDRQLPASQFYDAGDRVRYAVGYSNGVGPNVSTAYDVRLLDTPPPAKMGVIPGSVAVFRNGVRITTGFTNNSTATAADVTLAQVRPGDVITINYDVVLTVAVVAGETIPNTATVTWTSLPGEQGTATNPTGGATPGASGAADGERNGTTAPGTLNDYNGADTAAIQVAAPELTKSITDSSFASTTLNQFNGGVTDLAIGEVVTYQFVITLPEGTTNLTFTDRLPLGPNQELLGLLDLAYTPGPSGTFPLDLSRVTSTVLDADGDGVPEGITIDPGTLVNPPDGATDNNDRIVFTLRAQVLDVADNVAGRPLTNTATIDWGTGTATSAVAAEVVEPDLNVAKSVAAVNGIAASDAATPPRVDAGDVVTYRVRVTHTAASTAFASTIALTDALPAGLQLVPGSATIVYAPNYAALGVPAPTLTGSGNAVTFSADFLDHPGAPTSAGVLDEFVFEYRAVVTAAANPGDVVTNTQSMAYRSAPASAQAAYPNFARPYADSDPASVAISSNSVSGAVYQDTNNNGVRDTGEPLITTPVVFQLTGTDHLGNPVSITLPATTTGTYSFTGLRPSDAAGYAVTELTQPTGYVDGRDRPGAPFGGTAAPPTGDAISGIRVPRGPNAPGVNYNFGELLPASIGDFVWLDQNGNGRQDAGEPGVANVSVTLSGTDDAGNAVAAATATSGTGAYLFENLRPGTYTVTFGNTDGATVYVRTVQNSPVATAATNSDGAVATGATAGFAVTAGQARTDIDQGLYVPVSLGDRVWYDVNGDGVQDAGEPGLNGVTVALDYAGLDGVFGTADDAPGAATRTTSGDGDYLFDNLRPGTYRARVNPATLPNGLTTPTHDLDGVGTPNAATAALVSGVPNLGYDFGYRGAGAIGDLVWADVNANGVRDTVAAYNTLEPGIAGATVDLTWFGFDGLEATAGDNLTTTTTTDANGLYSFTNLPLGRFRATVAPGTLPTSSSLPVIPTYDLDSGTTAPDGTTLVTLTAARPVEPGADFGYFYVEAIGDTVYLDANNNGAQDAGEPGIPGVVIEATWAGPAGPVTFTTTTNGNGLYLFLGIPPGGYTVTVASGVPSGLTLTDDPDTVLDGTTSLTLGNGNPSIRLDIDFGYTGQNSVAGFVYRDFDIDGVREPVAPPALNPETGIGGVTITLQGALSNGGTLTAAATTAADGSYSFTGLPDGVYTVTQTQPPSVFAAGRNGFYDGFDSTGTVGGTPRGSSPAKNQLQVALAGGESGAEYNFGENPPADPFGFVYVDLNNNGTREPGEPGIANVAVTVAGTAFAGTAAARPLTAADVPGGQLTARTNAAGFWEFPILPPGTYSFTQTQPAGYIDGLEQDADPNGPPTTVGNDVFSNVVLNPFPVRGPFNFGELAANSSLAGSVYIDTNNNGRRDPGPRGIPGTTVTLVGTDLAGRSVRAVAVTDANGRYRFTNMFPGTYALIESQPPNFVDGRDRAGTLGGIAGNDVIRLITVGVQQNGADYEFGELGPTNPSKYLLLGSTYQGGLFPPPGTGVTRVTRI
ncbi:collagen-binding partial : Putative uncharacterized protein OS=uncultured prokaryote GN=HGMM_F48B01C05 PE=4 SV=1: Cna_B: Cna_B: Cna_B [Gemmataceae bacterium]|nr:collagen-binding partial : Putative uncharacterized protein OS=uncultured prokaryote GN=HGMM_F48B01C05 PE=4 SV=1: Cna_B: Cna_B: Cna_B [Gemmataceae bacterium]VTU01253.1 collagen-binding partial : Putative uncharacterized protein OS=uncultured prokaryote GN=HGMM_F48B01C05 PE=4 SV=1: Cna_B: Cna_B: Cna_B [Gemmataceae bacterium]